jgi:hypothetical protein
MSSAHIPARPPPQHARLLDGRLAFVCRNCTANSIVCKGVANWLQDFLAAVMVYLAMLTLAAAKIWLRANESMT